MMPAGLESLLSTDLRFDELGDQNAYLEYQVRMARVQRSRRLFEQLLACEPDRFTYRGYNALIGQAVDYQVDRISSHETIDGLPIPHYRERVICPVTRLNGRMRGTLLVLRDHLARDLSGRVYLTEQLTAFYEVVKEQNPNVIGSEYFGDAVLRGEQKDGVRNEDLTALTFADQSLDLVVCCEVLEHVPRFEQAYAELHRVLRPGGLLVLTVPFLPDRYEHLFRAKVGAAGEIVHLLEPEYHGDTLTPPPGVLCYQNFGWKLLDELRAVGFSKAAVVSFWSFHHGLMGRNQTVLYARR